MNMMQGDQYGIPVHITMNGEPVTPDTAAAVEISIGQFTKISGDGVSYDEGNKNWVFSLTQTESFAFGPYEEARVRVKLVGGDVIGKRIGRIEIEKSVSKAVL